MTRPHEGEVALVTGGCGAIGRAVARALAGAGCRVHLLDLRADPPANQIALESGGALHEADVSRWEAVEAAVGRIRKEQGRLDVLVHAAGVARDARLWKMTPDEWRTVLEVDLFGCWNGIRAVAPIYKEARRGRIVAVASTLAYRARAGVANYMASKSGMVGLVRAAAHELGPFGVTANAVAPGLVESELVAHIPADVRDQIRRETPTGRLATPEDVAGVVAFLCSDAARQISGECIKVDGGRLA